MSILKLSYLLGSKDQMQPWSYSTTTPAAPSASVLGPLRKREYQTRQQQIRQGIPRRIGCPPRSEDAPSSVHRQQQHSSVHPPIVNSDGCHRAVATGGPGAGAGGVIGGIERGSRAASCTSSYPAAHPLTISSSAFGCSDTTEVVSPDSPAMDWTASETGTMAPSPSESPSPSPFLGSYSKGLMMVSQAMGFGGGSSSSSSSGSGSGSSGSSSSNPPSTSTSGPRSGMLQAPRNPHLSAVRLGAGGRRMSTPSISTTSPYDHSSDTEPSASPSRSQTTTAQNSTISTASRTWVASSSSSSAAVPASDESNGYYNVNHSLRQTSPSSGMSHSFSRPEYATMDLVSSRIPTIISEREYQVDGYDKAFAVTWVTNEEVLMGTKCNKIVLLNTRTNKRVTIGRMDECLLESSESALSRINDLATKQSSIPRMQQIHRATSANQHSPRATTTTARVPDGNSINSSINNNSRGGVLGIASSLERGLRYFNPGRRSSTPSFSSAATAATAVTGSPTTGDSSPSPVASPATPRGASGSTTSNANSPTGTRSPGTLQPMAAASTSMGIRSLSINPSRTLLAIGSGDPFQVSIYAIPEFEPVGMMFGHTDLVFSLTWVSDTVLVTGSRDGSMKVWTMGSPLLTTVPSVAREIEVRLPVLTRKEDRTKVRDLAYNKGTGQLMTLSIDGYVKLWDRDSYFQLSKQKLVHSTDTVCITANAEANLFAVGSQSHISILDPRITSGPVHVAKSCDEGWGVRSLDFKSHIITAGGGYGRLGFYDLRAQQYLDGFDNGESDRWYQEIGSGWLNRNTAYAGTISGITIRNAVYAMEYDPTGTRLFTAGGPLQLDLCGAYAGLWS